MPKNLSNPDAFQIEAAAILAVAYESFPMPFGWSYDEDNEGYPTANGNSREEIQFQTIRWLIDNEYISNEGGFVGDQWQGLSESFVRLMYLELAKNSPVPVITPKYGIIAVTATHQGQSQSLTRGKMTRTSTNGIDPRTQSALNGLSDSSIVMLKNSCKKRSAAKGIRESR